MRWDHDYVKDAATQNRIISGFNVFGHEDACAIVRAAEQANAPILLMVNRDALRELKVEHWGALFSSLATDAKVPVGVHLDHCSEPALICRAMDSGFSSVMFDGSKFSVEENIQISHNLSQKAHQNGVFLEGELGSVPYADLGDTNICWTVPEEARRMETESGIDWLAVSVGNIHRLVGRKAPIHFNILQEIQSVCNLPLVIHGSSGITAEDMQKLRREHIGKMNMGTALRKIFGDTLREEMARRPEEFDRQKLMKQSAENIEAEAFRIITSLY